MPYDERRYFESFYRANVRGATPQDRMTIGSVSEMESRFHYNAVENSLIRAWARRTPLPRGAVAEAWRLAQTRARLRLLDIGSGTGHWIDFFRDVYLVHHVTGVEIVPQMAEHLRAKYAANPEIVIRNDDIAGSDLTADALGGPFDYVSAIGVMFHIVDDARWERACANLAGALKPGGWWFVGGDFGYRTRNVQFHGRDEFKSWAESKKEEAPDHVRVNKRVRSFADWVAMAGRVGLEVVDLIRADSDPTISTPENDVLVLQKPHPPGA